MFIPIYHIFIIRAHNARSYRNAFFVRHTLQFLDEGNVNDTEQCIRFVKNKIKAKNTPTLFNMLVLYTRVSQKNQKSEFCFATKPTGFHRLDEPPEKISAL